MISRDISLPRRVEAFVHDFDMDENTLDLILSLEHKLQIEVIEQFEVEGHLEPFRPMGTRAQNVQIYGTIGLRGCPEIPAENQAPGCTRIHGPMAPMFSTAQGTRDGNVQNRFFSFVRGAFGLALRRSGKILHVQLL